MLRRQTHHFCAKCKMNLREYRQKKCDKCNSNLLIKNSVVNESNEFIKNCQDNEPLCMQMDPGRREFLEPKKT